ncbi:MAG: hypothetical protein NZO16_01660, partial [Deltaproteobacteria bacterium]|nr:hypothetical protein [Deltaproteobacteria bacterium]
MTRLDTNNTNNLSDNLGNQEVALRILNVFRVFEQILEESRRFHSSNPHSRSLSAHTDYEDLRIQLDCLKQALRQVRSESADFARLESACEGFLFLANNVSLPPTELLRRSTMGFSDQGISSLTVDFGDRDNSTWQALNFKAFPHLKSLRLILGKNSSIDILLIPLSLQSLVVESAGSKTNQPRIDRIAACGGLNPQIEKLELRGVTLADISNLCKLEILKCIEGSIENSVRAKDSPNLRHLVLLALKEGICIETAYQMKALLYNPNGATLASLIELE